MASQAISTPLVTFVFSLLAVSHGQALSKCAPLFLPVAACAPFVQGTAQAPGQSCCENLNELYREQPQCLCLVLGDTPIISTAFPIIINRTLALELPSLCGLQLSTSICSSVSPGGKDNSTAAASSPSPTSNEMPRGGGHTMVALGVARSHNLGAIALLGSATLFLFA